MLEVLHVVAPNIPLTAESQSGGWVPWTSTGYHYWQPAPRWRLRLMAGNPGQLSHTPPCGMGETQAPATLVKPV